jgi:hypothetical protein
MAVNLTPKLAAETLLKIDIEEWASRSREFFRRWSESASNPNDFRELAERCNEATRSPSRSISHHLARQQWPCANSDVRHRNFNALSLCIPFIGKEISYFLHEKKLLQAKLDGEFNRIAETRRQNRLSLRSLRHVAQAHRRHFNP